MSRILSQKVISLFFALLFVVSFLGPFIQVDARLARGAKRGMSGSEIVGTIMDIAASVGGETVADAVDDFMTNLQNTAEMLKLLGKPETVDSLNFLIRNSLSSVGDAARNAAKENGASSTIQASDFGEFLESFMETLMTRCEGKAGFSSVIKTQVKTMLPPVLQAMSELYVNAKALIDQTGFGITFGHLQQASMLLSFLERPEYVSADTFQQFSSFPEEMKTHFETMVEELAANYIDPTQMEMMFNMARMFVQNFASRSDNAVKPEPVVQQDAEHDDL